MCASPRVCLVWVLCVVYLCDSPQSAIAISPTSRRGLPDPSILPAPPLDLEGDVPDGSARYHVHHRVFHVASLIQHCLEILNGEVRPELRCFVYIDFSIDLRGFFKIIGEGYGCGLLHLGLDLDCVCWLRGWCVEVVFL